MRKLTALLLVILALFTVACTEDFWEDLEESLTTTSSTTVPDRTTLITSEPTTTTTMDPTATTTSSEPTTNVSVPRTILTDSKPPRSTTSWAKPTVTTTTIRVTTTTLTEMERSLIGDFYCFLFIDGDQQREWLQEGGYTFDLVDLLERQLCQQIDAKTVATIGKNHSNWTERILYDWEIMELSHGLLVLLDMGPVSQTPMQDIVGKDELHDIAWCLEDLDSFLCDQGIS